MEKVKFVEVEKDKPLMNTGFFVQFNPETMSVSEQCVATQSRQFRTDGSKARTQGPSTTPADKVKKGVVLTLKLLFNSLTSFEEKNYIDVRQAIRQFQPFVDTVDKEVKGIGVIYGSMSIIGFVTSFSTTYTAFDAQGKALRAEVDISIEGKHYGDMKKSSLEHHREAHVMRDAFAQSLKESGNAKQWKEDAKAMHVEDPLPL